MGDPTVDARSGSDEPEEPAERGQAVRQASGSAPESLSPPLLRRPRTGPADRPDSAAGKKASSRPAKRRKPRSFWKELPVLIGIALLLSLLIKTFLVQPFKIPSDSMQNTLQRQDRVLVDKLTPWFGAKPQRGEIVVFRDPGGWADDVPTPHPNLVERAFSFIGLTPPVDQKYLIKRVIAVGGDTVECQGTGPVRVNGKALEEDSYLYPGATACGGSPFGPVHVPKGRIWVMGDHRNDSADSRYHQNLPGNGTLSENAVVGRAFVIAWPVNRWTTLPVPGTFDQSGINTATTAAPTTPAIAGAL